MVCLTSVGRGAHAATVQIEVLDAAGKPVGDAVVFLESAQARRQVRPLAALEMAQQKKQFVPEVLVVPVGSEVRFPNHDTVRHHVYSFSPAKKFELKLYTGTRPTPCCSIDPAWWCWAATSMTRWSAGFGGGHPLLRPDPCGHGQGTDRRRTGWQLPPAHLAHPLPVGARTGAGLIVPAPALLGDCAHGVAALKLSVVRRNLIVRLVGMSLLLLLIAGRWFCRGACHHRPQRPQPDRARTRHRRKRLAAAVTRTQKAAPGLGLAGGRLRVPLGSELGDEETIQSVRRTMATDRRRGDGAAGHPLNLRSPAPAAHAISSAVRQVAPLDGQPQGSRMAVIGGVPCQFVMVPMRAPVVIGWVLIFSRQPAPGGRNAAVAVMWRCW